jgi:hypothetical protein
LSKKKFQNFWSETNTFKISQMGDGHGYWSMGVTHKKPLSSNLDKNTLLSFSLLVVKTAF